jgi:hypothetical protein
MVLGGPQSTATPRGLHRALLLLLLLLPAWRRAPESLVTPPRVLRAVQCWRWVLVVVLGRGVPTLLLLLVVVLRVLPLTPGVPIRPRHAPTAAAAASAC